MVTGRSILCLVFLFGGISALGTALAKDVPIVKLASGKTYVSSVILLALYLFLVRAQRSGKPLLLPPGPTSWPILGNVFFLGQFDPIFEGFQKLKNIYGSVFSINLGRQKCVVVNDLEDIIKVLVKKGVDFGARPNFTRWDEYFGGDRANSLALCDLSNLQVQRRSRVLAYIKPRMGTDTYSQLNEIIHNELENFDNYIERHTDQPVSPKFSLLQTCCNIFSEFICSRRFDYKDQSFIQAIKDFDAIFYDINQGRAVDFFSWLKPFQTKYFQEIRSWSIRIRQFILDTVIREHEVTYNPEQPNRDYVDELISNSKTKDEEEQSWDSALYELEDLIGGHSAVGNFMMQVLGYLAANQEVIDKIREEINEVTQGARQVNLSDKRNMPYTESVLFETLRHVSSPIVPHVATKNTTIKDYDVSKGTVVFINNYNLNKSEELWEKPAEFKPERFIRNGSLVKPAHFLPFSTGSRGCMGQHLVIYVSFIGICNLLTKYDMKLSDPSMNIRNVLPKASLALKPDPFSLVFSHRSQSSL